MTTHIDVFRKIAHELISERHPKPAQIEEIYLAVEARVRFDADDLVPPALRGGRVKEPRWRRNVRNALQAEKDGLRLVNHDQGSWRLPTPLPAEEALDPETSWSLMCREARAAMTERRTFQSPRQRYSYRVQRVEGAAIVIERLDDSKQTQLGKDVTLRSIRRLNAAGGRAHTRTLNYTVANEVLLVELHPELTWSADKAWIEYVTVRSIDVGVVSTRRRYWALLANPAIYRISEAVGALTTDAWTTKGRPLSPGDEVAIWAAKGRGSNRGIVALGTVTSEPTERPDDANAYWIDGPPTDVVLRVDVAYRNPPGLPLWVGGSHDALLSRLAVCRARGGTVFEISDQDWSEIEQAARIDLEPTFDAGKALSEALDAIGQNERIARPPGNKSPRRRQTQSGVEVERDTLVVQYVLQEAVGICELCRRPAPFKRKKDEQPYLEVHHVIHLANGGPDTVDNAVALCPNCHRRLHHGADAEQALVQLYDALSRLTRPS